MAQPMFEKLEYKINKLYKNGNRKYDYLYDAETNTEHITSYKENGNKIYKNIYKNGIKDGVCIDYFDKSGSIKTEITYCDGRQTNEYKYYYPNGTIKQVSIANINNKFNRTKYTNYYPNGNKKYEKILTKIIGKTKYLNYYENGILKREYHVDENYITEIEPAVRYYCEYNNHGKLIKKYVKKYCGYYDNGYNKTNGMTYKNKILFFY